MTNRPHVLSCGLTIFLVAMLLLSGDAGPSAAGGLAVPVGPAPGDDPTLPPLSAVLGRESYEMIDTLADPVSALDPPPGGKSNSTLLWGCEASFGSARILSYQLAPFAPGPDCVPDLAAGGPTRNGPGGAFDPLPGNPWITRLTRIL